jgi:tetratricopeptide (TPR) repeat protein
VSLATGLVNIQLEAGDETPASTLALRSLVDLGFKFARCRPARLEVADEALGAELAAALDDSELAVSVRDGLPAVREMLREMGRQTDGIPPPPDALDTPGVTVEHMRRFAAAACEFYRAAPWQYLGDADLIHVEAPAVAPGFSHVTVLGAGGRTYGLGFFPGPKDFEALQASPDPETFLGGRGRWAVLYGPLTDMPFGDVDLWEERQLPVAGTSAYPVAIWFGADGESRRPRAAELADLEALLLALARSTEAEIDSGRWSREVDTHDGRRTVALAIPELLAPIDSPPRQRPGLPDRRAMERVMAEVERFAQTSTFESLEEMNAALRQRFSEFTDELPSTAATPLELAQDLMYRAFEARGRRRILLARKALEQSADCADAYVVLAEESRHPEEARALYEAGVAAGERALGPELFAEEAGHFWGIVRTRPYMRALFGLAQCLEALDQRDEAIGYYRELLRLNPGDNQGVRYSLLPALLLSARDAEAAALLDRFGDEPTALWRYGRALAVFRREGNSRVARDHLRAALRTNRHVPRYLSGEGDWAGPEPLSYSPGSREEAVICEAELGPAWRATPDAMRWLHTHGPRRKSGRRGKR